MLQWLKFPVALFRVAEPRQKIWRNSAPCIRKCFSLLVPHACQVCAAPNWQEGGTIWAAGGIFPRETPDIWLLLHWDLLLFRKRVPSVQLSSQWLYGAKWNDFHSDYTGIPSIIFLQPFWIIHAHQSGTDCTVSSRLVLIFLKTNKTLITFSPSWSGRSTGV